MFDQSGAVMLGRDRSNAAEARHMFDWWGAVMWGRGRSNAAEAQHMLDWWGAVMWGQGFAYFKPSYKPGIRRFVMTHRRECYVNAEDEMMIVGAMYSSSKYMAP